MSGRQQTHYVGDDCPGGHHDERPWVDCERCDGHGQVPASHYTLYPVADRGSEPCLECDGSGRDAS